MNACGAVVNSVNDALENGVLEGMHKQEDGSVMIAASHPDAKQFEQLGLRTISFTLGGVVQAGYLIMKICTSYQSQIAIVRVHRPETMNTFFQAVFRGALEVTRVSRPRGFF